jgi:hypothetical protein
MVLLVNVLVLLVVVVLGAPFTAAADATDRALWSLAGQTVAASVTQPFAAIFSTLMYFDLRERRRQGIVSQ